MDPSPRPPRDVPPIEHSAVPEEVLRSRYSVHRERHEAGDWVGLGELFAEDASYLDSVWGWSHGAEAIRAFLAASMRGLDDWRFPIHAVAIDASRGVVLNHWSNLLPGRRPDGGAYEVPGSSVLAYRPDGLLARQMDLFDTRWMMRTIDEWIADHDGALPYPEAGN